MELPFYGKLARGSQSTISSNNSKKVSLLKKLSQAMNNSNPVLSEDDNKSVKIVKDNRNYLSGLNMEHRNSADALRRSNQQSTIEEE